MICQVTNTQRKSWNIKKKKQKSEYVTVPKQFLKKMNFKRECFSSLIVTMKTEVIIFNIRLSIITKLTHEIQGQWHLAPMLVYDSIHLWARSYVICFSLNEVPSSRGTQREYSPKPLKHSIVERILVFKG